MRRQSLLSLLVLALCAVASFWAAYSYFKSQELAKAEARLTLYRSTVEATLQHYAHLPMFLSLDPIVIGALSGGSQDELNNRLARLSQSAGVDAIYLMNKDGLTIAASNAKAPNSFVGQNYSFRPYFQAAMRGELGEFYGIGATTGIPGYFYAMAVGSRASPERGVIAVKLNLAELQDSWQDSGERIIMSNADGVTLLASDPTWRYRTLAPLDQDQRDRIAQARQFVGEPLGTLDWTPNLTSQTAVIDDTRFLYLRTRDLPNSWSLHFFAPDDVAVARAWLATAATVVLGGLIFIFVQLRRVRQIGRALQRSEQEEEQLRQSNTRLAIEIEERRQAEISLKKTQAELERAGRLAALGKLSSSVTHELGQPIAAMRNQLAAAELTTGPSKLGDKMLDLVLRMEDITRQLKFFSRKGRDQFENVDLTEIAAKSLELLEPNISAIDAEISFTPPDAPAQLHGNRLRLEQVVTNLVRNALDAVETEQTRRIEVQIGSDAQIVWFEVSDSGPGLDGSRFEDLKEPFTTTRESGKGMGLGLTISAGIVSDHDGMLTAQDAETGGAVFRAEFPKLNESLT